MCLTLFLFILSLFLFNRYYCSEYRLKYFYVFQHIIIVNS
nr:MAG TPA: Membrane-associated protein [Caudoviricetes sp.]